jgi:hypothetical protein
MALVVKGSTFYNSVDIPDQSNVRGQSIPEMVGIDSSSSFFESPSNESLRLEMCNSTNNDLFALSSNQNSIGIESFNFPQNYLNDLK